jgi:kynurenine formamidase
MFPLDEPVDAFSPPIAVSRGTPRHTVLHRLALTFDDVYDNFFPQGSSQWDALGHVGFEENVFYNGVSEAEVAGGKRLTMEHWARHGIAGRAVILDMVRTLAESGEPYDPGTNYAFTVEQLERARKRSGVEYETGDILIFHTGFGRWFAELSVAERIALSRNVVAPGLGHDESIAEYLWNSHVAAVASDTYAIEACPVTQDLPVGLLHRLLIGQFGMALGELWHTEDLVEGCAADGIYEGFFVSCPLHGPGAVGSPANAVVIK